MPNESDKPGDEHDKGTEKMTDSSEQSLSKRVRRGTPSPHRGNAPQSSPPRFVSAEELMETAKGVTNMALAHEIVLNTDFQLKPSEPAEGSLEKRVKEIMHKAFWDVLEAQLSENPPSYNHAIKLLAEIKETLLSFLLPGHGRLRAQIEEVLDLPLIRQQAENGALDIDKVVMFVIGMMGSLCAPSRDEEIGKLREIRDLVPLLKAIFPVMDQMKLDMANFAVSSLRPQLLQQSVEYERKKFQEFVEKQPNALDFTEKWLQESAKSVSREGQTGGAVSSLTPLAVHNHAYLRLLKWNHASDPFPETLLMDQLRFQEMQQDLEQLVLMASVLLIVYNTTGEAISGLPGLMSRLKRIIAVLLADMHTPSFSADEAFATIGERMCVELTGSLSEHGFSPFSINRWSILKGQISAVILPDNVICKLIDSRIKTYLLTFLESNHRSAPNLPGGLAPVHKELEEIATKFSRLVNFNKLVYSPFYQKVLQEIVQQGESSDTQA
ncbi:T-complex protein 11-like protein 1 [Esox lucius]|uniref:T-complex 11, testis-specific-like 1 n=1 Tax=Esox lucius TaxID=8010 RepID=A0A3P8YJ26_ESOLU|nr:T-complex protein 11-like protein 1 [Esox lucius]XP_010902390.1 T-complex protein 11-like protein 1 [Esox lucius]XP_010902391.1 T-complex protein 11-like protein 1 [Esox lucius]